MNAEPVEASFRAMNTDVQVIVVGGGTRDLEAAEAAVADREARWSRFVSDSELSRVNECAGRPVVVSADTFQLISDAVDANRLTDGAFDPTVLSCLIGSGYDRSFELVEPGCRSDVAAAPGPAGIDLQTQTRTVCVPPGTGLDLGGIGKGATADAVTAELMANGVDGCCVNVGGDLRVRGWGPDDGAWLVDLVCPGADERRRIRLGDGAVCTSTTLKRTWLSTAGREHHLRDAATGGPIEQGLVSVSIVAARALQADVLTKAAFAAGSHGGAEVIAAHGATGLLIGADGSIDELPGFERFRQTETAA